MSVADFLLESMSNLPSSLLSQEQPQLTFLDLPHDVIIAIAENCDSLALRTVCRSLCEILSPYFLWKLGSVCTSLDPVCAPHVGARGVITRHAPICCLHAPIALTEDLSASRDRPRTNESIFLQHVLWNDHPVCLFISLHVPFLMRQQASLFVLSLSGNFRASIKAAVKSDALQLR